MDFWLHGGRVSLDLMATLGLRSGERLTDPEDAAAWLEAVQLGPVAVDAEGLAELQRLRDGVAELVAAYLDQRQPPLAGLELVNRHAAEGERSPRLVVDRGWHLHRPPVDLGTALGTIARDCVELLGGPEAQRIRRCDAHGCSGIYLDGSRAGNRRWCDTRTCGNRSRVAAHRAKAEDD